MTERVLIVVESLAAGGLAAQARLLVERLEKRGFEPHVALLEGGASEVGSAASVATLGRRHAIDPFAAWKLRGRVNRLRPAVIHAWGYAATTHAGLVSGRKLIATLGRAADRPFVGPGWRRPDLVVTPGRAIAGEFSGDLKVIPPGVAPAGPLAGRRSSGSRETLLKELLLPADARLIAVAGRMLPRKGVKELLWCGDLARVMRDKVRVLVAGDGPELPALARYASLVGAAEHLRLLGPRADVDRLLAAADVFWHAGQEASPTVAMLEAMSAGAVVVADDAPGARQVITDGENGRLVPPRGRAERARATEALLADDALADRLRSAARATIAQRYNADRMADDYAAAYRELIDGREG